MRVASRAVSVDLMTDGIFVAFEDGTCAIFSSAHLYFGLPDAEQVYVPDKTASALANAQSA